MKGQKVRVYVTKADYEKAMKEVVWEPSSVSNICEACVVSQAIRRTLTKLNLFLNFDIKTTRSSVYDSYKGSIAYLPATAIVIVDEFDCKFPFKPGRQFTLVLEQ